MPAQPSTSLVAHATALRSTQYLMPALLFAHQVAGSSPSSQASSQSQVGLDGCSLLATPAGAHNATDSSSFGAACEGWFSNCR